MKFIYNNHRGVTEERDVILRALEFMPAPEFHYEPGWFLRAFDPTRRAERNFSLTPDHMIPLHDQKVILIHEVGVSPVMKQSSAEMSSRAGAVMGMADDALDASIMNSDGSVDFDKLHERWRQLRSFAAGIVSQDETKGQQ